MVFVAGAENPIVGRDLNRAELAAYPWALPPVAPLSRRRLRRTLVGIQVSRFPFYEMETTTACLEITRDQRTITMVPLSVALIECEQRELRFWVSESPQGTNDAIHIRKARTASAGASTAIRLIQAEAEHIAEAGRRWCQDAKASTWHGAP